MKPAFRQLARKYGAWTALTVLALLPAIVHADPPVPLAYVLSDLGTVPGTTGNSFGFGVNDKGIVTGGGVFDTSGGPTTAFISGPNGASPLKPLEGSPGGFGYEGGAGINASGQVTGWDYTAGGSPRAFLSDPNGGTLHDLGTLPGETGSRGSAVNDRGQVAGVSGTDATTLLAFLSDPNGGPLHGLGTTPGGRSAESADGVNAAGEVTGRFGTGDGTVHACLSGPNGGALSDLGILPGGRNSAGYGVNASGQVAGWADIAEGSNTYHHAFLSGSNGGTLQDLGTLNGVTSEAHAVNDRGQVVGFFSTNDGSSYAFIYSGGVMTDLNSLLTPLSSFKLLYAAYSISNDGYITGEGLTSDGLSVHAFLLTPIKAAPKITVRAAASSVNGAGQRTVTVTLTNTGGAAANRLQMTGVTLNGAASDPALSASPVPTVPETLSNVPGMNTQTYHFVFKPVPGLKQALLHVVGSYTDPNNQQSDMFTASVRLPLR